MSNLENYTNLLETFQAIPEEKIQTPDIPVDAAVQEAEDLYHWSLDDEAELTKVGLDWTLVTSLPERAGACRVAQSKWMKERHTPEEAEKLWKEQGPEAYKLRQELFDSFRFAFRNDDALLARVSQIAEGTGHDDMIQDLSDLAELGKANVDLLTSISFDATLLDTAETKSDELGSLRGEVNGALLSKNAEKIIRDQAFTYMKKAIKEIRACGVYAFRNNPDRQKGYYSRYRKTHR